mmetsp:Transcript_83034/g.199281  ORF Transcript_83034/g.199281 Transcript_83034/m.199281 type:complete len:232 (+) Transcript_83034:71-766(+)
MASAESTCQIIKDSMGDNMPWKVQVSTGSTSSDIGSEQCQEFSREGSSASGLTELDEKIHSAPCVGDATSALAIGSLSTFPTMPVTPPPGLEASVEFELASEIPSKAQPMLGSEELEHQIPSLQELFCQQVWQHGRGYPMAPPGLSSTWNTLEAPSGPTLPATSLPPSAAQKIAMQDLCHSWQTQWSPQKTLATASSKPAQARTRQFCTECGSRLKQPVARFCTSCGHRLA